MVKYTVYSQAGRPLGKMFGKIFSHIFGHILSHIFGHILSHIFGAGPSWASARYHIWSYIISVGIELVYIFISQSHMS